MSKRNYLVNTDDLTLSEKRGYRLNALAAGLERCVVKGIGDVEADIPNLSSLNPSDKAGRVRLIASYLEPGAFPNSVDQRELVTGPARTDFVAATALDEMVTAALAVVGTAYSCFQAVAAPQLIINRLAVFYGVSIETVPIPVSYLMFRTGGAVGNVTAFFDLQTQDTRLTYDAFFSEPVVVDPQEIFAAQVLCKIPTGVAARVHLHNFVFGPAGQTVV
jgi:hypothetical protein